MDTPKQRSLDPSPKRFTLQNWKGDMAGGISAGIIGIPLALAFGAQSGLGPVAGLYGAIALALVASVLGGTPTQISGPTGPMVVITAMVVGNAIQSTGSVENGMPLIIGTFLMAGILQMLFGVLKFGHHIRYIPYPVVSGFMTGIGIIIILLQVFPILGKESPKGIYNIFIHLPDAFHGINMDAALLTLSTVAVIYMFPKISRSVPNILLALVGVSMLAAWTDFHVSVIGEIPSELPSLKLDPLLGVHFADLKPMFVPAITLALLGSIDSLLTSVIADNVTKTRHDSNQELVGQGAGNMFAALFGGIPGAGNTMSTLVNTNSGATTRFSGVVHSMSLILVLLFATQWAGQIPTPVLAGILVTVGIGIIDYKGLKHLRRLPREETIVMLLVLFMTVFVDLIQAVAIGLVFSSILFMKKMGDLAETQAEMVLLKDYSPNQPGSDEAVCFTRDISDKIYIKKLSGPLFFGFATAFQNMTKKLPDIEMVVLKMKDVPYIDQTGLFAMEEVILDLKKRGVMVFMVGLQDQPHDMLTKIDLIPYLVPEELLFEDLSGCAEFIGSKKYVEFMEED